MFPSNYVTDNSLDSKWRLLFDEYGYGISMYRTVDLHRYIYITLKWLTGFAGNAGNREVLAIFNLVVSQC